MESMLLDCQDCLATYHKECFKMEKEIIEQYGKVSIEQFLKMQKELDVYRKKGFEGKTLTQNCARTDLGDDQEENFYCSCYCSYCGFYLIL